MNHRKKIIFSIFTLYSSITGVPINPNQKPKDTIIGNKSANGNIILHFSKNANLVLNGNIKEMPVGKGIELRIDKLGNVKMQACPIAYKENITSITDDSSLIFTIDPKEFNYIGDSNLSWGIIAEDIINNNIFPNKLIMYDENNEPLAVYYDMIYLAMLIELKKLYLANIEKTAQITDLTSRVTTLENRSYGPYAEDADISSINQNNDMSPVESVDVSLNDFTLSDSQYNYEEYEKYEEVPEIPSEGAINPIKSIHVIN